MQERCFYWPVSYSTIDLPDYSQQIIICAIWVERVIELGAFYMSSYQPVSHKGLPLCVHFHNPVSTMLSLIALLSLFLAYASGQTHYLYGPTWGYRRSGGGAGFIISLETTLVAGKPTSPPQPRLALWPGMDTSKGLIQPIIVTSNDNGRIYAGCSTKL
jgi:hypothetical protein